MASWLYYMYYVCAPINPLLDNANQYTNSNIKQTFQVHAMVSEK
jgi:hypothetical protein